MLIVGCGCRGRELAAALCARGHAVRGTTRNPDALPALAAAGVEGVLADPDRLGTLLAHLRGVSALCWLLGSASGDRQQVAALHGQRLASLLEKLVDTPVRGFVYEGAGTVAPGVLAGGSRNVEQAGETFRMRNAVVTTPPRPREDWVLAMSGAVDAVLT